MLQTVRISSKRQMTIPVKLFDELGMKQGDDLVARIEGDSLVISKTEHVLESLAGAVHVSGNLKKIDLDVAILKAKEARFSKDV